MGDKMRHFFGEKELKEDLVIKKVRWSQALEACEELHNELRQCKRTSWLPSACAKEHQNFWDCVSSIVHPEKSEDGKK